MQNCDTDTSDPDTQELDEAMDGADEKDATHTTQLARDSGRKISLAEFQALRAATQPTATGGSKLMTEKQRLTEVGQRTKIS